MRNTGESVPKESNIAAIVNGDVITLEDIDQQYNQLTPQEKQLISKDMLLDVTIDNKLLLQKVEEENIVATDEEIDADIAKLKTQFTSEELFNQFIEEQGKTLEEFREVAADQIEIKKLLDQEAFGDLKVEDSEIQSYYDNNIQQFTAQEGQIRAAHILIETEEEAQEILNKISAGLDFSELAKEFSIGPSAVNGGNLGFFAKGVMVKEFEDAAFSLEEGEVSGVVQTQFGYHVIKRLPDIIPLEEVSNQIKQSLLFSKQRAVFQTYMDQLRAQSDITIYLGKTPEEIAEIEIPVIEEAEEELTFDLTGDGICKEDEKPVIRMFSTSTCPHCNWIKETFDYVANEYAEQGLIKAYHWVLDSGDNTLTEEVETKIPKEELEIFKKYNSKYTVPTFVFGCQYVRAGNAFESNNDLESEKKEFKKIIEMLL